MKARTGLVLATFAAAIAAGSAPAWSQGATIGPAPAARPAPAAAAQLDDLKAQLKLSPAQLEAWNAYASRVKAHAADEARLRREVDKRDGRPDAGQRAEMQQRRTQASAEISPLRDALLQKLSAEQRRVFLQWRPAEPGRS